MGAQRDVVVTHTTGYSHDVFLQSYSKIMVWEKKKLWYNLKCKKMDYKSPCAIIPKTMGGNTLEPHGCHTGNFNSSTGHIFSR